jgi:16S rRNA G1207 methylase RsmC
LIKFTLKGRIIELASSGGVFSKDKVDLGTQVLLSRLDLPERGDVLDLGCGYGVIGITIAKLRPGIKVTMADVNPSQSSLRARTSSGTASATRLPSSATYTLPSAEQRLT